MDKLFYTEETKGKLEQIQKDPTINRQPLSMAVGVAMLDALGEMQNTLQGIAGTLEEMRHDPHPERSNSDDIRVKRGEVYYADLDGRVGSEQKGRRPVVIMQNNVGNAYSPTVVVVPATSQTKNALSTHVPIHGEPEMDNRTVFMAEQIQTIDKTRIRKFVCALKEETVKKIESAIKAELGMGDD